MLPKSWYGKGIGSRKPWPSPRLHESPILEFPRRLQTYIALVLTASFHAHCTVSASLSGHVTIKYTSTAYPLSPPDIPLRRMPQGAPILSILTPVFPSDAELGLLRNQLRTFQRFMLEESVDEYLLVVPAMRMVDAVLSVAESIERMPGFPRHKLRVIADPQCVQEMVPGSKETVGVMGWMKQQMIKLGCAALVRTPFYLVMDVDVFFTSQISQLALFSTSPCTPSSPVCDALNTTAYRAKNDMFPITGRSPDQLMWMENSGRTMRLEPPAGDTMAMGVTPQIMSKDIVLKMGEYIQTRLAVPRWQMYLLQLLRENKRMKPWLPVWTEFNVYWLFAVHTGLWRQYHVEGVLMKDAVWQKSDWEKWQPCETAFGQNRPGYMALVQSNLEVSGKDIWKRIRSCF